MTIFVIDCETTANGGPNKDSPEAHWPNNKLLLFASDKDGVIPAVKFIEKLEKGDTIVGHNLKFDLKWLMRIARKFELDIKWSSFNYVCTMESFYKYTGHQRMFTGLEDLASELSIPTKKTLDLSTYLGDGGKMEDIPEDDLRTYLLQDVHITSEVWHKSFMVYYCNWLPAICEMELNGLPVPKDKLLSFATELARTEASCAIEIKDTVERHFDLSDLTPGQLAKFNNKSPRTLSYLFTGEPVTGVAGLKVGTKKAYLKDGCLLEASEIARIFKGKKVTHLGYPMDEGVLSTIERTATHSAASGLASKVLEYRKASKLLNTYCRPMLEHLECTGGTVHPKINLTATKTGRLSSSSPNGQNMPEEIRKLVESPDDDWEIAELDFEQLEIVALAQLSRDRQLIADLKAGRDLHYETGKDVFGWKSESDMNDKDRKICKNVNFGLIYGGTEYGLSKSTGQPMALVKSLIEAFYSRYPRVSEWHEEFYRKVVENSEPYEPEKARFKSKINIAENLDITFIEGESPEWVKKTKKGRDFTFVPTQTKNYPVQGYAGRVIVPTYLKKLYHIRDSTSQDIKFLLTVHDSIIMMVKKGAPTFFIAAQSQTENTLRLRVPLNYKVNEGKTWS